MEEEIKPGKIYTSKEVRSFLKISESTMKRMIKNGLIKAFKVSGRYRIWGQEILRLVSPKVESRVFDAYKKIKKKTTDTIKKW
jgi:excisionase family DNA binding protein